MLSPRADRERVLPFDARILAGMGGGGPQCRGRFDQAIPEMLAISEGVEGILQKRLRFNRNGEGAVGVNGATFHGEEAGVMTQLKPVHA